jgi:hypothetical protein
MTEIECLRFLRESGVTTTVFSAAGKEIYS